MWKCVGTHKMLFRSAFDPHKLTWCIPNWWWCLDMSYWYMHDQIWQWIDGICLGGAYALNNALLALWLEFFGDDSYVAKWYILLLIVGWPREWYCRLQVWMLVTNAYGADHIWCIHFLSSFFLFTCYTMIFHLRELPSRTTLVSYLYHNANNLPVWTWWK